MKRTYFNNFSIILDGDYIPPDWYLVIYNTIIHYKEILFYKETSIQIYKYNITRKRTKNGDEYIITESSKKI